MSNDETTRLAIEGMKAQIARRCVHYSGALDEQCKAGVVYDTVRRKDTFPFLPCIRWGEKRPDAAEPPDTCTKRHFPTPEEVEKEHADGIAAVRSFFESLAEGLCPVCHKPIGTGKQVGRSFYADCGHRIGQLG